MQPEIRPRKDLTSTPYAAFSDWAGGVCAAGLATKNPFRPHELQALQALAHSSVVTPPRIQSIHDELEKREVLPQRTRTPPHGPVFLASH